MDSGDGPCRPSSNPNDITYSNPNAPFLAPVATGPWGSPQPPARPLDADFWLGADPLIAPERPAQVPPLAPCPLAPVPAAAPAPINWHRWYVASGVLAFLLFCGGWVMAFGDAGTRGGWWIFDMGWPFGVWFLIWGHRNPKEAAALGVGLAVLNHEQAKRNEARIDRANANYANPATRHNITH